MFGPATDLRVVKPSKVFLVPGASRGLALPVDEREARRLAHLPRVLRQLRVLSRQRRDRGLHQHHRRRDMRHVFASFFPLRTSLRIIWE